MTKVSDLHRKWMKTKEYRKAYQELAPEFELARAVIQARTRAGLSQEQLARRMDTTQEIGDRHRSRIATGLSRRASPFSGTRPEHPAKTVSRNTS